MQPLDLQSMRYLTLFALLATCMARMEVLHLDWYYRQCNTLIVKNAALTTPCNVTSSTSKGGRGSGALTPKQLSCFCNLEDYRLSLFGCINYAAKMANTKEESVEESWEYMQDACGNYSDSAVLDYETNRKEFFNANITQSWKEANSTKSGAFVLNNNTLSDATCRVYAEAHWQGYYAQMMPLITTWYLAGIFFVQALIHWSSFFLPGLIRVTCGNPVSRQLRKYVVLPAMFNNHRATPLKVAKWILLCFPPRLHVVFLTGYLFLSIFFLIYHFPWINNGVYWDNYPELLGKYLGVRSGQLGMHKMVWLFLFAGRNNILIWFTGWQFEIFNHWHRWVSRLFTVDIIIHTVLYAVALKYRGRLPAEWSKNYMVWGWVATIAMLFMCVNGTKPVRKLAYEFFLYSHIVLAVFCVIGTYYHVIGEEGINELYAVIAVWAFDRLVRIVRILVSNPFSKGTLKAHPEDILEIEIKYSGLWKPKAGTYIFIHFVHPLYFIQSHPFTIVPMEEKGKMRLYCKALKGITRTMYNRALDNNGTVESRLLVEGPYGVEFATKQFKELVLIAGGIGVTAIYSHLKEIVKNGSAQVIHVHWVMTGDGALSWFKKELEEMAAYENVNIVLYVKTPEMLSSVESSSSKGANEKPVDALSESVHSFGITSINRVNFKPNVRNIVKDHICNSVGDILFFVCGPSSMADDVRKSVANNLMSTRHYVEFFEESFSM